VKSINQQAWQPFAALVFGMIAASSASILIRYAQNEEAPSLVIAMWRVALATAIFTPFVLMRHLPQLAKLKREEWLLAGVAGVALAIHFAAWITSLEYTSVLVSVTLVTTNPLMVAMVTPFLLKERPTRTTYGAILLAIVGVVIITAFARESAAPKQDAPILGAILALVGAAAVGVYFIIGRRLRKVLPLVPYAWLTYGGAALTLTVLIIFSGQPVGGLPANAYFWMTLCGLIPQLIGHSLLNFSLGYLSAAFVSLSVLSEPILSSVLAVILFGPKEMPQTPQLAGSVLILVALVVASREEVKNTKTPSITEPVG
jgi:drug/metabolite transporter (DMT)-like permease